MRQAVNGLIAIETRQLEELTPAEVALERQWQQALEPALRDLYWHPLRNGINEAPEGEAELRRWLREKYRDALTVAVLAVLLNRFLIRGFSLGGQLGLGVLGVGGTFQLANRGILDEIEAHTEELTTLDRPLSLIDTTVDNLVAGIPKAREDEDNTLLVLAALIGGWSLLRSVRIAATEQSRMTARGLGQVYGRNGIAQMEFQTRADDRVCEICAPHHGKIVPVNNVPAEMSIPLHTNCRCVWVAVTQGWQPPANVWRGE